MLDEAERSLHDALCVLSQTVADARTLPGGGWPEMAMAHSVQSRASRTPGKRSLAMEAFAAALRGIPATISENAGACLRQPAAIRRRSTAVHCTSDRRLRREGRNLRRICLQE